MPTATSRIFGPWDASRFALRGVAWSVGLFGLLRLQWFEAHAVLPLTHLQARIAEASFGKATFPITVTLACSGADALAICAAAILAYPSIWSRRLEGVAGGIALILALNTIRIGTLGRTAGSPSWFEALHLYIWPAVLTLAIAGYVAAWMRLVDRRSLGVASTRRPASPPPQWAPTARFVGLAAAGVVLFGLASPLYLANDTVLAAAALVARVAAVTLRLAGMDAAATGNILSTSRGAFMVTQECIATPLIPVYLAAVVTYMSTWRQRALWLLAAPLLFVGLGIARLLVVALPVALVGSPAFVIHAFSQWLIAISAVGALAVWRYGIGTKALVRTMLAAMWCIAALYVVGLPYGRLLTSLFVSGTALDDPQAALRTLPAFQLCFLAALVTTALASPRWRPVAIAFASLALSQVAGYAALQYLARHAEFVPHVRDVRAWALAGPLLLAAVLMRYESSRR